MYDTMCIHLSVCLRGVRPFGVSLLIVGYDEDRPYLFQCDPSVSCPIMKTTMHADTLTYVMYN